MLPFSQVNMTDNQKKTIIKRSSLANSLGVNRKLAWQLCTRDMYCHKDDINVICELLAVKHGDRVRFVW